jgi:hypothetical protein
MMAPVPVSDVQPRCYAEAAKKSGSAKTSIMRAIVMDASEPTRDVQALYQQWKRTCDKEGYGRALLYVLRAIVWDVQRLLPEQDHNAEEP